MIWKVKIIGDSGSPVTLYVLADTIATVVGKVRAHFQSPVTIISAKFLKGTVLR